MKIIPLIAFLLLSSAPPLPSLGSILATDTVPEVGKPMPHFVLDDITHYGSKQATLDDFKGKWLFLDFWFLSCTTCIQSFPHINALHKEFKDQLHWVMIGKLDNTHNRRVKEVYEKFRNKHSLEMPSAYDSILFKKWEIRSAPHIIIVDPAGIVRHITGGRDLVAEKIKALINGEEVSFYSDNIERPEFEPECLLPIDDQMSYISLLTKWNGEEQWAGTDIDFYVDRKIYRHKGYEGYKFAMVPLYALFNIAYLGRWDWDTDHTDLYGKYYPTPILELRDSSLFQYDYRLDVGKGCFNYYLKIPKDEMTKENIMRFMQEDLTRYCKYNASVESRNVAVWKLVTTTPNAAKQIKSKNESSTKSEHFSAIGLTLKNSPANSLIGHLSFYHQYHHIPFIDETGIVGNIDFSLKADMTDLEDIRKALRRQGFDLIKGMKEMQAIVIRDQSEF